MSAAPLIWSRVDSATGVGDIANAVGSLKRKRRTSEYIKSNLNRFRHTYVDEQGLLRYIIRRHR